VSHDEFSLGGPVIAAGRIKAAGTNPLKSRVTEAIGLSQTIL
jgi:hypothetical protein